MQAVVNIAAARHMTTTAEGVETEQQREVLRALGCTEMQGYLFSPPKPAGTRSAQLLAASPQAPRGAIRSTVRPASARPDRPHALSDTAPLRQLAIAS